VSRLPCNPLIKELRKIGFEFDDENRTSRIFYNSQTGTRATIPAGSTVDEKHLMVILNQALPEKDKKEQIDKIVASIRAEDEKSKTKK